MQLHVTPGPKKANGTRGKQRFRRSNALPRDLDLLLTACSEIDATGRLFLHGVNVKKNVNGRAVLRAERIAIDAMAKRRMAEKASDDAFFADRD